MKDALGKRVWDGFGWVAAAAEGSKVLEWEYVGAVVTRPMDRREAANWGSRPSMSMAIGFGLVSYVLFYPLVVLLASLLGTGTARPGGI